MKKIVVIFIFILLTISCKSQSGNIWNTADSKYDTYNSYIGVNPRLLDQHQLDIIRQNTLINLMLFASATGMSTDSITAEVNKFNTLYGTSYTPPTFSYNINTSGLELDSLSFDDGTTWNDYILDSNEVLLLVQRNSFDSLIVAKISFNGTTWSTYIPDSTTIINLSIANTPDSTVIINLAQDNTIDSAFSKLSNTNILVRIGDSIGKFGYYNGSVFQPQTILQTANANGTQLNLTSTNSAYEPSYAFRQDDSTGIEWHSDRRIMICSEGDTMFIVGYDTIRSKVPNAFDNILRAYDTIFYLAMSIPSDTGWLWVNPTNGAVIIDSLATARFGTEMELPSIKERLNDIKDGEYAWYISPTKKIYGVRGNPSTVIKATTSQIEFNMRELGKKEEQIEKLNIELKEINKRLTLMESANKSNIIDKILYFLFYNN